MTRDSARSMARELSRALMAGHGEIVLDFSGVNGITPSFLDETLGLIQDALDDARLDRLLVRVLNPPTRLTAKFEAVGRGRGLLIRESGESMWIVEPVPAAARASGDK